MDEVKKKAATFEPRLEEFVYPKGGVPRKGTPEYKAWEAEFEALGEDRKAFEKEIETYQRIPYEELWIAE